MTEQNLPPEQQPQGASRRPPPPPPSSSEIQATQPPITPNPNAAVTEKKQTTAVAKPVKGGGLAIVDEVLGMISEMQEVGGIDFPPGYSVDNALKAAKLEIQQLVNKNSVPALESCTHASIVSAVYKMCLEGLNPLKGHGSFIVYGDEVQWQREIGGDETLAKRNGVKDVVANVIHKDDIFEYGIDNTTGRKAIINHKTALENLDKDIIGAYAVIHLENGEFDIDVMTMRQIQQSWNQGKNADNQKKFPVEFCKRTVTRRALKKYIRSSDDSDLFPELKLPEPPKTNAKLAEGKVEEHTIDAQHVELKEDAPKSTRDF